SGDYDEIQYWASETATTTEKIRVDNDVNIYENGQKSDFTLTNVLGADGKSFYRIATFALNDPQGTEYDYDTAYVLDYENAVVDSVNTTAGRVSMKEGNTINYGENYTNVSATLYDKDGNQIEWSTVQENDVISSLFAQSGDRKVYTSTLIRKTVEGVITEVTSDDDTEYRIGDAYYKVDPTIIAADELNLQDEGIFYLDIFGRVAYYDAQSTLTSSYAYVIDSIVEAVSFDNRLQIKAFTFEGEVVTLTGATRITVREGNASAVSYKNADANDTTFGGLLAKIPQGTVITFAVNSQGEISRIGLPVSANNQVGLNYFSQYAAGTDFDYRGNTGIIRVNNRSVEIAEDTIIMIANTAFEDDDFDLLSLSLLGEEDILEAVNTTAYDVDKNMVAGLIIVNGQIDVAGRAEGLAFVTGTSQIKDDYGDNLDRLTVLQGGASKQIDVSDALSIDGILFKAIAPTLNAKGLMSSFKTIAAVDATGNLTTGNGFVNDDYVEYVVGKVVDKTGSRITVNGVEGNGDAVEDMLYSIPNTANIYLYNDGVSSRALKARLVDDLGIFDVDNDEYFDEYGNKLDEVDVLIRYYDGKIQDVVIYLDTTYAAPAAPAE
ncbi:MAG: hypothetical protein GX800_03625, partial [Clostridiaceae bacterium]|nr:hypothetical protein [Clostridiaceae bacterium]